MATVEELIFTGIKSQLETDLAWVNTVEIENPIINIGDLGHHVLPLVQVWWDGDSLQEQNNSYTITKAPFMIEVIDRSDFNREINQFSLFQYRVDILASIKAITSLPGVSSFQQFSYVGRNYDIHMAQDFFIAQLSFQAWFQEFYGQC